MHADQPALSTWAKEHKRIDWKTFDFTPWKEHYGEYEISYGTIILNPEMTKVLLMQTLGGHWGFAKGHRNNGETPVEAAIRETSEEMGVHLSIHTEYLYEASFDYTTYYSEEQHNKHIAKQMAIGDRPYVEKPGHTTRRLHFFVMVAEEKILKKARFDPTVVRNVMWFTLSNAEKIMAASVSLHIEPLSQVVNWIAKKKTEHLLNP
jgi:8-oxo-dGTP pyrophosphatase MutT (NUDIX family)